MTLVTRINDDVMTIQLGKKFDFDYISEFRDAYIEAAAKAYIVDFRDTEYMDSSGLGMLLNMRRHLGGDGVSIKLVNCRPQVKKVLLISRFETKFNIG